MLKMALLAPMPSPSVAMISTVTPRCFRKLRRAKRMSSIMWSMQRTPHFVRVKLSQGKNLKAVERGGVRHDHPLALLQSFQYFDGIGGGPTDAHLPSLRGLSQGVEHKQAERGVLLAEHGALQRERLWHPLQLNDAVYPQIAACAGQRCAVEGHVHDYHALLNFGLDAAHYTRGAIYTGGDDHRLPRRHVLDLAFLHAQLCLKAGVVCHAGQNGTDRDLLPLFHRDVLQMTGELRTHRELVEQPLLQLKGAPGLTDARALGVQFRLVKRCE